MKRRQFLGQVGWFSATAALSIGAHGWAVKTGAAGPKPKRSIVIFLRGAVDGLNVVVPYREADYYRVRPNIAISRPGETHGALDLDGQFGLHPVLAPLLPLWQEKSLAFVHACGSPEGTRSHFEAQDYMESGTPGVKRTSDGWMNRLAALLPSHNPVQAVNVGNTMPRILSGKMPVAVLPPGRAGLRTLPLDRPQVSAAFDRLYRDPGPLSQAYQEGRAVRQALLRDLEAEREASAQGAPLPEGFAGDARRLAKLMVKNPNVQLGFLALGGWDTHVNQGAGRGQLAARLKPLGEGLVSLVEALGPIYSDTAIVVLSEFGRTVKENGNRGTDHGHGNVIWLLGGTIAGGKVYGKWTGLSQSRLYQGRDLPVTTDFRDVMAAVLKPHFQLEGSQMSQIFPGHDFQPTLGTGRTQVG